MPYTDSLEVVSVYLYQRLLDAREDLEIEAVLYGDQELIGSTPALCVIPLQKERTLDGAMMRSVNNFSVHIMIYHGALQDNQENEKESIHFAEGVEAFLHADRLLGQGNNALLYHSIVMRSEPGAIARSGTMLRATRLSWEGFSKTGVSL